MHKLKNLLLLVKTVKNFHLVLLEYLRPGKDKLVKLFTRKNQVIFFRSGTTDFHEIISVLSGREYPLEKLSLGHKPVIINIGAHIGTFELFIKSRFKKATIYSFEPNKTNFEVLQKNIKANKYKNIKLFNNAVSAKNGYIKLYYDPQHPNEGNIYSGNNFIKVKTRTLKAIIQELKIKNIDLLKLDCEGCEYEILPLLPKNINIRNMAIEYHTNKKGQTLNKLMTTLEDQYLIKYHQENKALKSGIVLLEKIK